MGQFASLVKGYLLDKKWAILIMGTLIGMLSVGYIQMLRGFDMAELDAIMAAFPEGFLDFFGDVQYFSTPYGFVCLEFFLMMWLYAGIYLMWVGSGLIAQEVEDKTIELALTKPIQRNTFLGTKLVSFISFIFGMMGLTFLIFMVGALTSPMIIESGLYLNRLWATYLNTSLFLCTFAVITVFISTLTLKTKKAMMYGIIMLFILYFLNGIYPYFEQIDFIKYFTLFNYFNPVKYMVLGDYVLYYRDLIVLLIINTVFIIGSYIVFNKKDIPI